jgi:isoleucyl-tRNA synthetase
MCQRLTPVFADKKTGEVYILCEARIAQLYPPTKKGKPEDEYEVLDKFKGVQLKDKQYVPLFPYFEKVLPSFPSPFHHATYNDAF